MLTLDYSDCEVPEASAVSEQPPCLHTEECQNSSPPLAGTRNRSASLISDSDPALCTAPSNISKQVNVQSADDVADVCSPSVSVAVDSDCPNAMFHLICSSLQSVEDAEERQRLYVSLRILLQFFEAEYLLADTSSSASSLAFPLHLVEQYTKLIKDDVSFYSSDG